MNDSQQVVKARKDWVALQRLLACMRDTEDLNNDLLANQSWQSLLFRAELAQQLWKDINNSQEYHSFLLSHEQESPYKSTSQQVDYLCRRAHDLARRLKEEEDEQESKQDIIHQFFVICVYIHNFILFINSSFLNHLEQSLSNHKTVPTIQHFMMNK